MIEDLDPFLIQPKENKGKLDDSYKSSWVEDAMVLGMAEQDEDVINSGSSHIGSNFSRKFFFLSLMFISLSLVIILGRFLFLQILQGDVYRSRAEGNRQRIIPIPSERGLIFDRNNIQLTQNIPNFSLAVIPQDLPKKEIELKKVIITLADITGKNVEDIAQIIEKYKRYQREYIVVEEDIPYEIALKINIASADLPGILTQQGSKRLYNPVGIFASSTLQDNEEIFKNSNHSAFSHIFGYVGKLSPEELYILYEQGYLPSDSIGKTGVEKTYEQYLRGTYGHKRIEVNALGKEQSVLAEEQPSPGSHIILSIDSVIQNKLEEIMRNTLEDIDKIRASGIILNPQNGEVLALVSLPGFDNNDFSGGIDGKTYADYIQDKNNPLFNRSIGGTYPSGSVIKPAIAAAALQEDVITPNTTFKSTGGIAVGDWFFPDWKSGGHGNTDVRKSIAWSVNTFYYYIGGGYRDFVGLGVQRITDYLRKFGFSKKLGIDIPAEASGFLPSPEWKKLAKQERWYVGDTYNLSIGQGDFLTTPLQIASMTATIANGGTLYKPHVVSKITDPITEISKNIDPEVIQTDFINSAHLETIRLGMHDCVSYGSCWKLRNLPFSSAGKTGTAQWNSNRDTHAWFTSFAPFESPEIVVTILVEEGGEGSLVAQPIAWEFYKWWGEHKFLHY